MNLGYAPWKGFSLWSQSLSRRRARPGCTAGTLSISVMTLIWMRLRSVCRHWGRSRRARSLSRAALWGIARRGGCNLHASSPNFLATPICALRRSMQRSWMKTSARQLILSQPYNQNELVSIFTDLFACLYVCKYICNPKRKQWPTIMQH